MLRSFLSALAVLAAATAAQAGVVTAEQKLADQRALVETSYETFAMMRESAEPLIDYAATQPNIPFMSVKVTGFSRFSLWRKLTG